MRRSAVAFAEREGVGSVLSAINYARERESLDHEADTSLKLLKNSQYSGC